MQRLWGSLRVGYIRREQVRTMPNEGFRKVAAH